MITTISIYQEDLAIWNEFLKRIRGEGTNTFHEFMQVLKQGMDDLDEGKLLYMFTWDIKNKMCHLYLAKAYGLGIPDNIPENEILKLFDYSRDERGRIIDLREKKEEDKQ